LRRFLTPKKEDKPLPFYVKDFPIIQILGYIEGDAKKEDIEKTLDTCQWNRHHFCFWFLFLVLPVFAYLGVEKSGQRRFPVW